MAIELKGLNNVIRKLDNLSDIKTKDILQNVAVDLQDRISADASGISPTGAEYVGVAGVRDYGLSAYMDVGLKDDITPFENWKTLWFQHWGFIDKGLNFNGQYYISNHKGWFEESVNKNARDIEIELKEQLRKKVKGALK